MAKTRLNIKTVRKNLVVLFFLKKKRAVTKGRERVDRKLEYSWYEVGL